MTLDRNPAKLACLNALSRGELEHSPDGWRSVRGLDGLWNSHTVTWLSWQHWCAINGNRAVITRAGREYLQRCDEVAA